jgi:hypothetical protein
MRQRWKRASHKRRVALVIGLGVLMVGGSAFGYFMNTLASSTGTSHITTGTGTPISATVSPDQPPIEDGGGALIPMTPTLPSVISSVGCANVCQYALFSISAPSPVVVNHITWSVAADGSGNVLNTANGNAPAVGCLASWYVAPFTSSDSDTFSGSPLAPSQPFQPGFTLTSTTQFVGTPWYLEDNGGNQDACESVSPQIVLTISG